MAHPDHPPLGRPPEAGDPVKVVVEGTIEHVDEDGDAVVVLHGLVIRPEDAVLVVPADQVWNHARPDQPTDDHITTT